MPCETALSKCVPEVFRHTRLWRTAFSLNTEHTEGPPQRSEPDMTICSNKQR